VRIAVIGYGKMGHEVEAVLRERGHEPVIRRRGDPFPAGCAAGIDFTKADSVVPNVTEALQAGARYVVGTTGWNDREAEVRALVERHAGGLVHGANFSLGVGLFYQIVRSAAALLARPATAGNIDDAGEQLAGLYHQTPIRPVVLANIQASTRGQRGPVQNQRGQAIATVTNTQAGHQHVRVGQGHMARLLLRAVDAGFRCSRRQRAAPHGGVFPGALTAFPLDRRSRP
jgi:hypothetical protein